MNHEWLYHFLIGYDQNSAPALVAFCVNTQNDCVVILPYTRLYQNANLPIDENKPPIIPAKLGSLNEINVRTKSAARWVWDMLCNDPNFQMKPTDFKAVYPNHKYSTNLDMSSLPPMLHYRADIFRTNSPTTHNTNYNYALEA
jgi:hypothetical protein